MARALVHTESYGKAGWCTPAEMWPEKTPWEERATAGTWGPHSPSQAWHPLCCAVLNICGTKATSLSLITELQRDYYSLLKLGLSWKQIFLIVRKANHIKICWKIWVGTRHRNVPWCCRCCRCHSLTKSGLLCKNKHDPGMFTLSLECTRCAKLDFVKTPTNGPKVVCMAIADSAREELRAKCVLLTAWVSASPKGIGIHFGKS